MTTRDWYQADDDDSDRARSNTAVWRDRGAIIAQQQTRIAQLEAEVERLRADAVTEAWDTVVQFRRAEAAESKVAAVEAMADEFDLSRVRGGGDFGPYYAEKVRAVLASVGRRS